MKKSDINENIKERLNPFLITDWSILPSEEDLSDRIQTLNKEESEIKVTDANVSLWFAKGLHGSVFFLKDYSLDCKIPKIAHLPTEYMGALVIHANKRCIFSACWYGYDIILMNEIKTCFGPYPISKNEIEFCFKITQTLSSH